MKKFLGERKALEFKLIFKETTHTQLIIILSVYCLLNISIVILLDIYKCVSVHNVIKILLKVLLSYCLYELGHTFFFLSVPNISLL